MEELNNVYTWSYICIYFWSYCWGYINVYCSKCMARLEEFNIVETLQELTKGLDNESKLQFLLEQRRLLSAKIDQVRNRRYIDAWESKNSDRVKYNRHEYYLRTGK